DVPDHHPIFSRLRVFTAKAYTPIQATLKMLPDSLNLSPTKTLKLVPPATFTIPSSLNLLPNTCPLDSPLPTSSPSSPHTTNPPPVSGPRSILSPHANTPTHINSCS